MSENSCGHCALIGAAAGGICKIAASGAGPIPSFVASGVCRTAATAACEKVSHCSISKSAE